MNLSAWRSVRAGILDVFVVIVVTAVLEYLAKVSSVAVGGHTTMALAASLVWLEYNWFGIARFSRTIGYALNTTWVTTGTRRWWRSAVRASVVPAIAWLYAAIEGTRSDVVLVVLGAVALDRGYEVLRGRSLGDVLAGSFLCNERPSTPHRKWRVGRAFVILSILGVLLGIGEVTTGHHLLGSVGPIPGAYATTTQPASSVVPDQSGYLV